MRRRSLAGTRRVGFRRQTRRAGDCGLTPSPTIGAIAKDNNGWAGFGIRLPMRRADRRTNVIKYA